MLLLIQDICWNVFFQAMSLLLVSDCRRITHQSWNSSCTWSLFESVAETSSVWNGLEEVISTGIWDQSYHLCNQSNAYTQQAINRYRLIVFEMWDILPEKWLRENFILRQAVLKFFSRQRKNNCITTSPKSATDKLLWIWLIVRCCQPLFWRPF